MKRIAFFLVFIIFSQCFVYAQYEEAKLDSLNAYFARSLKQWSVPGMAIGIVKGDSLIFAKGYGFANIKDQQPVDKYTIFPIASNTKAFTVAAMAILVDRGEISWNTKVVDILPYFQLYSPYVTAHFTIADMLSHRSGLKTFSGDLIWYGSDYSREEVIKKLPFLKQAYEFRTKFGYSNIMYIAASEVIAKVSGMSYEDFLRKNFFDPLGMKRTYTSINDLAKLKNVCTPYNNINGKLIPIEFVNWDNIGGAGCINSDVMDMSKWIKFQLNGGIWHSDTIISSKQILEMRSPHTNFTLSKGYRKLWPSTHFKAYAMGWSVMDYHGRKIISHSGGYDGVITYTCLVPEDKLGFVILTNSTSSLYNPLSYRILDSFLAKDTIDWASLFLPYQQHSEEISPISVPAKSIKPSLKSKKYLGLYKSKIYGNALITGRANKMKIQLLHTKLWEGIIKPYNADTFIIEFPKVPSLPQGFIRFKLNADKTKIESFVIDVPNPDFDFTEFTFKKLNWIIMSEENKKQK